MRISKHFSDPIYIYEEQIIIALPLRIHPPPPHPPNPPNPSPHPRPSPTHVYILPSGGTEEINTCEAFKTTDSFF